METNQAAILICLLLHLQILYTVGELFYQNGQCEKGKIYTINSTSQLATSRDLECIFHAALSPSKVPEGRLPLRMFAAFNNQIWNTVFDAFVSAKNVTKIECLKNGEKRTLYVGLNEIVGRWFFPFVASIGPPSIHLASEEYNDGKDNFVVDYGLNFNHLCDDRRVLGNWERKLFARRLWLPGNYIPIKGMYDIARVVGRQDDGVAVLLGKMLYRNSLHGATTYTYFSFTSQDENLNPDFLPGQSLPPLEEGFAYKIASYRIGLPFVV